MPKLLNFIRPKPKLKPNSTAQLSLLPDCQPPTENRLPPNLPSGKLPRTVNSVRGNLPLRESIDYDKLSPSQQARWDAGLYGSIDLKNDRGNQYYVVRWKDPRTGKRRSDKLDKDFNKSVAILKKMILG